MILYLMRHAEAVPIEFWPEDDKTRPISDLAEAQIVGLAEQMKRVDFKPNLVAASPYVRATQTATQLCEALGWEAPVVVPKVASGARGKAYHEGLKPHLNNKDEVLVVGHMPDVAIVASQFVGEAALMEHRFEPGEIMAIEITSMKEWGTGKKLWNRRLSDWKKVN